MLKRHRNLLIYVIVACVAVLCLFNLFVLAKAVTWPYSAEYNEGAIYSITFNNLYKSIGTYPYVITYYPPLFYLINDGLNSLVSLHPFVAQRSLSFLATVLDTLLIYLIARRMATKRRLIQVLAPLLFLSPYLILQSGAGITAGPVMFELLFDLLAMYLMVRYRDRKALLASAVTLVVALLFRQTAVFIFLAIAAYLVLNDRKKDAAIFAAAYLLMAVPVFLWINLATGGTFFLSLFTLPATAPFTVSQLITLVSGFLVQTWTLPLLVFAIYWIVKNKRSFIAVSVVVGLLYVISSAKTSANLYYFMVFYALFCICAVAGIDALLSRKRLDPMVSDYIAITLVLVAATMAIFYSTDPILFLHNPPNTGHIGVYLRNVTGNILVEDPTVAVVANKTVMFEPSMFWVFQYKHLWNDSGIVASIKAKEFGAIAFPDCLGRFNYYSGIINATGSYYNLSTNVYGWDVYTPILNGSGKTAKPVVNVCLRK
jgi:hypothetical protein